MIDTHCHIDLYSNPEELATESERLGIVTIGVTNLPSHFEIGYQHLVNHTKVKLALGMHPLYAESHQKELAIFLRNIDKTSFIGEIGLDFSEEGISSRTIQLNTFKCILDALNGKVKILSLHSRKAEQEVHQNLIRHKINTAIFHWYSGPLSFIADIVKSGFMFSINPAMIRSKSGQRIIQRIPINHILTESDGPFISIGTNPVRPKDVVVVQNYLSTVWGMSVQEVEIHIYNNYMRLMDSINPSLCNSRTKSI